MSGADLHRAAIAANEVTGGSCHWGEDGDGQLYATGCGKAFYFDSGDVGENGFRWCPYCGRPILRSRVAELAGGRDIALLEARDFKRYAERLYDEVVRRRLPVGLETTHFKGTRYGVACTITAHLADGRVRVRSQTFAEYPIDITWLREIRGDGS